MRSKRSKLSKKAEFRQRTSKIVADLGAVEHDPHELSSDWLRWFGCHRLSQFLNALPAEVLPNPPFEVGRHRRRSTSTPSLPGVLNIRGKRVGSAGTPPIQNRKAQSLDGT
eukprot:582158-Amphidinium_carterae.2